MASGNEASASYMSEASLERGSRATLGVELRSQTGLNPEAGPPSGTMVLPCGLDSSHTLCSRPLLPGPSPRVLLQVFSRAEAEALHRLYDHPAPLHEVTIGRMKSWMVGGVARQFLSISFLI